MKEEFFEKIKEVDNERCVIVEFVNEDNKFSVDYRNWLKKIVVMKNQKK